MSLRLKFIGNSGSVARMLEKKHGLFDDIAYDLAYNGVSGDLAALCEALKKLK